MDKLKMNISSVPKGKNVIEMDTLVRLCWTRIAEQYGFNPFATHRKERGIDFISAL
jgi:hypothetical protein